MISKKTSFFTLFLFWEKKRRGIGGKGGYFLMGMGQNSAPRVGQKILCDLKKMPAHVSRALGKFYDLAARLCDDFDSVTEQMSRREKD